MARQEWKQKDSTMKDSTLNIWHEDDYLGVEMSDRDRCKEMRLLEEDVVELVHSLNVWLYRKRGY